MPAPRASLVHRTSYTYERPVQVGPQLIRLRPLPDPRVPAPAYRLEVTPTPASLHWLVDPFGNLVARMLQPGPLQRLDIAVVLGLDLTPRNPFDFVLAPEAESWPFRYAQDDADALMVFRRPDHPGPLLLALCGESGTGGETVGLLLALAARVVARVAYIVRMEAGVWPPDRTLAEGRGSCRDSAWLLVQLLRLHGIAARFMSGYLVQIADGAPDSPATGGELHAWAEAYLPGAGWVGIDATSGLLCAQGHVGLAASVDPAGAAPLTGTVEPAQVTLETSIVVDVTVA